MDQTLLEEIKNYLNITYEEEETNRKVERILESGIGYLKRMAGRELELENKEAAERELLFDYCRYGWADMIEEFEKNFFPSILQMQLMTKAVQYAEKKDIRNI